MADNTLQKNISKGWQEVRLDEVAQLNPEQIDPTKKPFADQVFTYLDIGSISKHHIVNVKEFIGSEAPSRARRVVYRGDVVVSLVRPNLRAIAQINKDINNNTIATTGFCVLRGTTKVHSDYLYQLALTDRFTNYLISKTAGSNYPAVNSSDVGDYVFALPSAIEQKKIAEILSTVDDQITKTEEIISETEKLKSGLMRKMFAGKGVNTKLGEIASIVRGGSPRPIEDYITDEPDGLNWLKIGDIEQGAKYITHTSQKIKQAGLKKTTMVHSGDFILSNSMSFGRPYIMKIDACIHDGWLAFKDIKTNLIDSEFLYYLLSSELLQKNFTAVAAGSGVKNLKRESVSNIVVKLLPLDKQKEITRILSSVDNKITVHKKIKSNLLMLKRGLMQDLLTGKVRTI